MRIPYKIDEAKALCDKLQQLVGYPYDIQSNSYSHIECVAIAPFDLNSRKKFIFSYLLCNDAERSLAEEYKFGIFHEVIVMARSLSDSNDIVYMEINTWLEKNEFSLSGLISAFANDTQADIQYLRNQD